MTDEKKYQSFNSIKKRNQQNFIRTNQDNDHQNQKFIPKWSENNFYHQVKKRIQQKIKTQANPSTYEFSRFTNTKLLFHQKPKSKLTVSTLKIIIDPMQRKITKESFQVQRKIYHKADESTTFIRNQPIRITKNTSDKFMRQKVISTDSSHSMLKKQQVQTCRKNTKIATQPTQIQPNALQKDKLESMQFSKTMEQNYFGRLKKSKSQMSKLSLKNDIKSQYSESNPFLFYFKAKSSFKISDREMSVKKIRIKSKSKNKKVYI